MNRRNEVDHIGGAIWLSECLAKMYELPDNLTQGYHQQASVICTPNLLSIHQEYLCYMKKFVESLMYGLGEFRGWCITLPSSGDNGGSRTCFMCIATQVIRVNFTGSRKNSLRAPRTCCTPLGTGDKKT